MGVAELEVLQETLQYSLKLSRADDAQRVLRIIKALCSHLLESTRAALRAAYKVEKRLAKSGAKAPTPEEEVVLSSKDATVGTCRRVYCWLAREVQRSLYPRATFDRELLPLQIIKCVGCVEGHSCYRLQWSARVSDGNRN